ncbi:hypothetical protein Pint_30964 [Pistacia integerrima]|uniref:Uncharacterized protein n=1 Tax=Pistacia integerrima TaxID=434235 RepID=A0ACC0XSJ1_9ROSI|nr:hypothetical protein Pint_30964 [Pistacia integerrima]
MICAWEAYLESHWTFLTRYGADMRSEGHWVGTARSHSTLLTCMGTQKWPVRF